MGMSHCRPRKIIKYSTKYQLEIEEKNIYIYYSLPDVLLKGGRGILFTYKKMFIREPSNQ